MALVFLYAGLFLLCAAVVWILARAVERQDQQMKIQSLEARLQLTQSRNVQVNEQLARTQTELMSVSRSLDQERGEKGKLFQDYVNPLRRRNLATASVCLLAGILAGSYAGFSHTERVYLKKVNQLEVARAVSEFNARHLEQETERLDASLEDLRHQFQREMEARVIAETKLEMITGSPAGESGEKRRGFNLFTRKHPDNNSGPASPKIFTATARSSQI